MHTGRRGNFYSRQLHVYMPILKTRAHEKPDIFQNENPALLLPASLLGSKFITEFFSFFFFFTIRQMRF